MVAKIEPGTVAAQQNAGGTPLKCPRCDSSNTKFCYYNNYSLTQPRHYCKSCKRYWTRGGALRNVPVGGGTRKNKRTKKHQRTAASQPAAPSLPSSRIVRTAPMDLSSLLCGLSAINSETFLLPKFDLDAQVSGYEGIFQSCIGTSLEDLHKSAPVQKEFVRNYTSLSSQIPYSSSTVGRFQPLHSYDELPTGILENTALESSTQWQITEETRMEAVKSFEAASAVAAVADSSYTFWNQAVNGVWLESGSSASLHF